MKDLYGLRKEQVDKLKTVGLLDNNSIVYKDGNSIIDGQQLFVVGFNTSEERDIAYDFIYS